MAMNEIIYNEHVITKAVTHAGKFHADDVLSACLLRTIDPNLTIFRLQEKTITDEFKTPEVLFFDTGDGEFDHHRSEELRENGIPYAAFGKLWRKFWVFFVKHPETAQYFDDTFIAPMDLADTKGVANPLSTMIAMCNLKNVSFHAENESFYNTVRRFTPIFDDMMRDLRRIDEEFEDYDVAIELAKNDNVPYLIIHDTVSNFDYLAAHSDAKVVIYPSSHGGTSVRALGKADCTGTTFVNRYYFPKEYCGHRDELLEMYPDLGMKFCHVAGFMAVFQTSNQALDYVKKNVSW